MKIIKQLRCWWRGHDLHNTSEEWICFECGTEISYSDFVEPPVKIKIYDFIMRFKFWGKCPDCGKRFGKHDPSINHIPF